MRLRQARSWLAEHQSFLLLLAAFAVSRVLAILLLRPGGFLTLSGPDQYYYLQIGRLAGSGQIPYFDFWMEYPPLAPWLAALAYRLSLHFPPVGDQIFWFNLFFRLLLLPFSVATLALVYACARCLGSRERALQVAALWALLFAPLFTLLSWFAPLVLFFLVLGLYGLLTGRAWVGGLATGLGFMAKVFPVALFPVALFSLRSHRQRAAYVATAAVGAGLVILPPLLATPRYVLAVFDVFRSLSSWETVWALLEGYKGYGVVAPLAARADPATASFAVHPARLPWVPITLGFALLYGLVITRHIAWQDRARVALFSLFSLAVLVLYSKGYSPQWAAHLGTLALLALPTSRGLGYALLLDVLLVVEWPIAFVVLREAGWFLAGVIVIRTVLIVLLGLDALARVFEAPAWRFIRRAAFPAAFTLCLAAGIGAVRPAGRAYAAARLEQEPLTPLIRGLQHADGPADPVIIVQPELLERLRPYLRGRPIHLFPNTGGVAWEDTGTWLPATLEPYDRAWLLFDERSEGRDAMHDEIHAWFDAHAYPNLQTWYGSVWAGHYVLAPQAARQPVGARFAGGLRLVAATPPSAPLQPGKAFAVELVWGTDAPLPGDYAVFVQLLSPGNTLVAQSDVWPAGPTSAWTGGEIVTRHGLIVPNDLLAGTYTLQAGLYDAGGARLPLLKGGDAALLGDVVVANPAH